MELPPPVPTSFTSEMEPPPPPAQCVRVDGDLQKPWDDWDDDSPGRRIGAGIERMPLTEETEDLEDVENEERLTFSQARSLEREFEQGRSYLEPGMKSRLAAELGLRPQQVVTWFQNHRARKYKELVRHYETLATNYKLLKSQLDALQEKQELQGELQTPQPDYVNLSPDKSKTPKIFSQPSSSNTGESCVTAETIPEQSEQFQGYRFETLLAEDGDEPIDCPSWKNVTVSPTGANEAGSSGLEISYELQSKDLPSKRLLGKGLSGIGYETTWKGGRFARKDFVGAQSDIFVQEAAVLVGLKDHRNIVKTYGWTVDKRSCSLVLEYMDDDLVSLLQRRTESKQCLGRKSLGKQPSTSTSAQPCDLPEAIDMMLQIATGMECLHEQGIAHGDLKTRNILVAERKDGNQNSSKLLKVADFGLVRTKRKSKFIVSRQARKLDTVQWKAPEHLKILRRQLNLSSHEDETSSESESESTQGLASEVSSTPEADVFAADVYSFAVTCSEILTGGSPYPDLDWKELMSKKLSGLRPNIPGACPSLLREVLTRMLQVDPAERPSFSTIRKHLSGLLTTGSLETGTATSEVNLLDSDATQNKNPCHAHEQPQLQANTSLPAQRPSAFTAWQDAHVLAPKLRTRDKDKLRTRDKVVMRRVDEVMILVYRDLEQERRRELSENFEGMRRLVPTDSKTKPIKLDNLSTQGNTIVYVEEIRNRVAKLEARMKQIESWCETLKSLHILIELRHGQLKPIPKNMRRDYDNWLSSCLDLVNQNEQLVEDLMQSLHEALKFSSEDLKHRNDQVGAVEGSSGQNLTSSAPSGSRFMSP